MFGNNNRGQLGVGDADSRYIPVRVKEGLEGKRVVDVAIGQGHTLLLTDDHTVLGMGDTRWAHSVWVQGRRRRTVSLRPPTARLLRPGMSKAAVSGRR